MSTTLQHYSSESDCSPLQQDGEIGVDFFTLLPPELVFCIVLYLPLRHFLVCLAVSKNWHRILGEMEPYWRRACEELGISRDLLTKLIGQYSSFKEVIFQALRHRHSVLTHTPKPHQFSDGYPYYMHYICHHMKGNHMVGTVYRNFQPYKILVERLDEEDVRMVVSLHPTHPLITENRIIWAYMYGGQNLFCATASGVWSVYDINSTSKSGSVVLQWRAEPMYDPEIRFACCDRCGMVCTAKLVISHLEESFWELRVVEVLRKPSDSTKKRLPMPRVTKFKVELKNKEITSRRSGFGKKKIILLSTSTESTTSGFCTSHLILVQWANAIEGHMIRYRSLDEASPLRITQSLDASFEVECSGYDEAIMKNHGLNTEFALSEDRTRLGVIFQSYLTTWEINSSTQSSRAPVTLESYSYEEMKLIALGHIYSIVGLEFNSSLIVLATRTGQKLLTCDSFTQRHCSMGSPYIVFFSSVGDGWLSDISQLCWSRVVYWNKTNRCIEGVELGQQPASSESQSPAMATKGKKKHWWQQRSHQ